MDRKKFEAIAFGSLFEVNNHARERDGLPPLTDNQKDKRHGWPHYSKFRNTMRWHLDGLWESLKPYLED